MKAAVVLPPYRAAYELSLLRGGAGVDFTIISSAEPTGSYAAYKPHFVRAFERPNFPKWMPLKSTARPVFYDALDENQLSGYDGFIVVETFSFLSWQFAKIASRLDKKLVVITWETISRHPLYSFIPPYFSVSKFVSMRADTLIAMTQRSKNHLANLGVSRNRTFVIYPGVELDIFRPPDSSKKDANVTLLFVGLLEKHKGFDLLLSAYLKAKRELDVPIRLLVVGEGSLAKVLGILNDKSIVHFGRVPREHIAKFYQQADIFISPARDSRKLGCLVQEEQFGFTLVEALACGLPIISTNCGAIPEIVGDNNVIVDQGSIEQLVNAIKILAKNQSRRESVSKKNRERATQLFDLNHQSIKFTKLIEERLR